MLKQFTVVIHKEDDLYVSLCPELNIASQGSDIEKKKNNLKEAIVNGFCKEVFKELPMEFAVEAQALLGLSLEGSVG